LRLQCPLWGKPYCRYGLDAPDSRQATVGQERALEGRGRIDATGDSMPAKDLGENDG